MFSYVYPGYRSNVPAWVLEQLIEQARADVGRDEEDADLTRGTLISRFSFAIDVREWGFSDPRGEMVRLARNHPIVRADRRIRRLGRALRGASEPGTPRGPGLPLISR